MPSLERFFNPQMRVFSANIASLPGARLYFFEAGSTTPKVTYADKQGTTPNTNPVIASSTGTFPPIFLDGLYRVELRSSGNIVQPGWPIDNVGQDNIIVPFGPWIEIVSYSKFEIVTDTLSGIAYRSLTNNNLGNVPLSSPDDWEAINGVPEFITETGVAGRTMNAVIVRQGNVVTCNATIGITAPGANLILLPEGYRPQPFYKQYISGSWYPSLSAAAEGVMLEVESDGFIKFVSEEKVSGRIYLNFNIIQGIP